MRRSVHTRKSGRGKMPAAAQTVKKPLWVVWRAAALQMQSESGDMCGGFGSLAQQGFLTLFPAREAHRAERETVQILGKGRRRRTFSTRGGPGNAGPIAHIPHEGKGRQRQPIYMEWLI